MKRQIKFDGSYRVVDWERRAWGNTYTDASGLMIRGVHPTSSCQGRFCVIHNPSDHPMRLWPTNWRWDRHMMERICPHGVGHPDPDDQAYLATVGRNDGVHGCDGCCGLNLSEGLGDLQDGG